MELLDFAQAVIDECEVSLLKRLSTHFHRDDLKEGVTIALSVL